MRLTFVITAIVVLVAPASGQGSGGVEGRVVAKRTLEPLVGVNIVIAGLNRGTATDIDGAFSISDLAEGAYPIVARFVGFKTETITTTVSAGATAVLNFEMEEDRLLLDELVVTGLGTSVERRKLSANVEVLHLREIETAPVMTVGQLLQGRVPGASVRMQSAQPGLGSVISFRGVKSVSADQTPAIYIDGVRVDNNSNTSLSLGGQRTSALSELLTSDIERIEIAMGGAASTLYGSEAANGVIQIFTKQGTPGQNRVVIRSEQGIDVPDTKFVQDTDFAYAEMVTDPSSAVFGQGSFLRDVFLRTGHFQNYYVGVSGGGDAATYNVSGRVQNSTGIQPSNESTIYALRSNVQSRLGRALNVGFSGSYVRSGFERLHAGNAIFDPYSTFGVGAALVLTGADTFDEALRLQLLPEVTEQVDRFTISAKARYEPSRLFKSGLTVGLDSRTSHQRVFLPIEYDAVSDRERGEIRRFDRDFLAMTVEYVGTISYPREGRIKSDLTFGVQGFREDSDYIQVVAQTFALPGTEDISQAGEVDVSETRSEVFNGGIFVREQVGFRDRLYADAGLRLDGSTSFGGDVGLQGYPSFGLAYTLSDNAVFQRWFGNTWSHMKLRISYGETGRFPKPFDRDVTFGGDSFRGESAPFFENPGNLDLKPERTRTVEGGFDAALLSDNIGIRLTAFSATTSDALFLVPEQPSTGRGLQLRNLGQIENKGIELGLDADVHWSKAVSLSLGLTYSWLRNEVTDIGDGPEFSVAGDGISAISRVAVGHPVGEWYASTPIDSNGDGLQDAFEYQFAGSTPYPTQFGSLSANLSVYRNLSLFATADWSLGARTADHTVWVSEIFGLERAVLPERFDTDGNSVGNYNTEGAGVFILQNGDFLKIREVSARYSLPSRVTKLLGLHSAVVFSSVRNLVTFVRQDLVDPELAGLSWAAALYNGGESTLELGGEQLHTLSPPRQIRFGFEIVF
ncbi:MAG: SusC/RagA family TonB-linked outer membrane protein [Rhodothermales bacterium]|nr:SusC/RagA family TonB-linked outer membrane protein [Rhodothermales bacterium]